MTNLTPNQISEAVQDALRKDNANTIVAQSEVFITIEVILGIIAFSIGWGFTAPVGFTILGLTVLARQVGVAAR
jgi:hypothetical protein